jgi:hypothetical protein
MASWPESSRHQQPISGPPTPPIPRAGYRIGGCEVDLRDRQRRTHYRVLHPTLTKSPRRVLPATDLKARTHDHQVATPDRCVASSQVHERPLRAMEWDFLLRNLLGKPTTPSPLLSCHLIGWLYGRLLIRVTFVNTSRLSAAHAVDQLSAFESRDSEDNYPAAGECRN